jgi:hypothetical protein
MTTLGRRRPTLCRRVAVNHRPGLVYPWPLSPREVAVGMKNEKQQGDLAIYWRRAYESRQAARREAS